jgi:hypothetical protein
VKPLVAKIVVSVIAIVVIAVHLLFPKLAVDATVLGLLVIALLPWLSSLIKSAELPGGWKIEFQDMQAAGAKVTESAEAMSVAAVADVPSYVQVSSQDPNLALVGLRIEIEKRLRALAQKYELNNLTPKMPLGLIFQELRHQGILDDPSTAGLQELIVFGNNAAHGAVVDASAAAWAIDYGPQVLAVLDAKLAA